MTEHVAIYQLPEAQPALERLGKLIRFTTSVLQNVGNTRKWPFAGFTGVMDGYVEHVLIEGLAVQSRALYLASESLRMTAEDRAGRPEAALLSAAGDVYAAVAQTVGGWSLSTRGQAASSLQLEIDEGVACAYDALPPFLAEAVPLASDRVWIAALGLAPTHPDLDRVVDDATSATA